ncbi:V/A-type H+/Na+-transporting ATPase subunit I [Burkholderiales bacterium]|nr:V/A-type H+/Na+-transporting ATPase subunit I [Burkholderiales bacterium]
MIRPRPARWFEILAARDDATIALEALAATGAVELEARAGVALPAALADLRPGLAEFAELASRYRPYWPATRDAPSAFPESPAATLERSLASLRAWAADAEPAIRNLQRCGSERDELGLWRDALLDFGESPIDFAHLAGAGPVLHARLLVYPADAVPELPPGTIVRNVRIDASAPRQLAVLAVGRAEDVEALARQAALFKGRMHEAPSWFAADAGETASRIAARLEALDAEARRAAQALEALHAKHRLPRALADADRLQWLIRNVSALESGEHFCWITGWTSDLDGSRLAEAIERSGARSLMRFAPPSPEAKAPLLLANPAWARPFEVFSRAMGMPSSNEADPSALLAVAVPLMFGYMFGDVGQGLVIAGAGFALRRRFPIARLFVAGGLAAAVFGVLFGSVFSVHAFPALWVAPLDAPLTILIVPLAGGAALLTLGLALNALEAWWRREFTAWLATDLGYAVAYLGILAGFLHPAGFVAAAAGAVAFCAGRAAIARRAVAALTAIAALAERLVQILINTLSFARVGAFALAHAGLSSAIVALADAAGHVAAQALVLVAGNLVVLALETLVVSIQTTRLVLFEFFTRFLTAGGRIFRPLPAPPSLTQESAR